jgi:hypothetical protein
MPVTGDPPDDGRNGAMHPYTTGLLADDHMASLQSAAEAERRAQLAARPAAAAPTAGFIEKVVARVLSVARSGRTSGTMTTATAD